MHLGDWGLQIGLIIAELERRKPDLPYFDESFTGPYPEEAPFTISELEEIYPTASARSKEDEPFAARAHEITFAVQQRRPGYYALWRHIMQVSVADLRKNYDNLNVSFDVWKGESDAQPYIPPMLEKLKAEGVLVESEGVLVVTGENLHIGKLSLDGGELHVDGRIDSLAFEDAPASRGGFLSRLLGG